MSGISENERQVFVVMYHYVHDQPPAVDAGSIGPHAGVRGLSIRDFSEQLDQLCLSMEPIDWPALQGWVENQSDLPRRSFLLTFDDGLVDHARHVAPELERRGLTGTFFVPAQILTARRLLSAHAIHLLLSKLGDARFEQELRASILKEPDGSDWAARLDRTENQHGSTTDAYHYELPLRARLKSWLTLELPIPLRQHVIDELFGRFVGASEDWARQWYAKPDELRSMQARGHTIGGHGYSHEPLARMEPRDQQEEMTRCAQTINETLGSDARPFSYPFGSWNESAVEACREAGFIHAFTTDSRPMRRSDCTMRLPRIDTIHLNDHLPKTIACATPG